LSILNKSEGRKVRNRAPLGKRNKEKKESEIRRYANIADIVAAYKQKIHHSVLLSGALNISAIFYCLAKIQDARFEPKELHIGAFKDTSSRCGINISTMDICSA